MLDLGFLGKGSAFNTLLGNTSAFLKKEDSLLLIDIGTSTFGKIMENFELLEDVKNINVLITHLHPDHVGSLGDLIFYTYYVMNIKLNVIFPQMDTLIKMLEIQGVLPEMYEAIQINTNMKLPDTKLQIEITPLIVKHVPHMQCYGYFLRDVDEYIFYSGDCSEPNNLAYLLLEQGKLNRIYQDTCYNRFKNNPHLNIDILYKYMELSTNRNKVHCMHWDKMEIFTKIQKYGFNYV